MNNLFIVWTKYQARVESLKEDLDNNFGEFQVIYRENPTASFLKKIFLYFIYLVKDFNTLVKNKPKVVFVQTPPSYALLAPYLYKLLLNKDICIICDLHNAMTREPWLTRVGTKFLLNKSNIIVVHNQVIYESVMKGRLLGTNEKVNISTLEDKTPNFKERNENINGENSNEKKVVFFPASFNKDEPIREVLESAKLLSDCQIIMTGNFIKLKQNFEIDVEDIPSNVTVTGWIPNTEYFQLLKECDVLLGLTIFDDIQMSVSNEGLGEEKIMVLSNKLALRQIYQDGVIYTENEANSIADNINLAFNNKNDIKKRIKEVKINKEKRYKLQLEELVKLVIKKY